MAARAERVAAVGARAAGDRVAHAAEPGHVALFGLRRGVWSGPALYSIVGMRLANERSGSTSLFAHPVALEAVPLEGVAALPAKDVLESRLEEALKAAGLDQIIPLARSEEEARSLLGLKPATA